MTLELSPSKRPCWCGSAVTEPYSPEYRFCPACGSLVSQFGLNSDELRVRDDATDYYGKSYWQSHQTAELNLPSIEERAVHDLPRRCVHWLRHLLASCLPPARVLELGCAHGAFVSLMRAAGYDAQGLEVSPWVVDFARKTFDVPILAGPLEEQALPDGSFDAIVLNDLLEHLDEPRLLIEHCVRLLKPTGLLFVQTPKFPDRPHAELLEAKMPFLEMMSPAIAREHLHLFSDRSARMLLEHAGLSVVEERPAAFVYDMYLVASRTEIPSFTHEQVDNALRPKPSGRLVGGFLALDRLYGESRLETQTAREQYEELRKVAHAEIDRLHDEWKKSRQQVVDVSMNLRAAETSWAAAEKLLYEEIARLRKFEFDEVIGPITRRVALRLARLERHVPFVHRFLKWMLRRSRPGSRAS